uniref:Uncharacterized protein n=1 Tax=Anguilla anguilla TaxID=7936 RepID=A0A0E9PWH4_ANGAN
MNRCFTHEQRTELLWVSQDGKLERGRGAGVLALLFSF